MDFGMHAIMSMGRTLSVAAQLKRSFIEAKTIDNYLTHEIIIAKTNVDIDPNNVSYRKGRKICPVVRNVLDISLSILQTMWVSVNL